MQVPIEPSSYVGRGKYTPKLHPTHSMCPRHYNYLLTQILPTILLAILETLEHVLGQIHTISTFGTKLRFR